MTKQKKGSETEVTLSTKELEALKEKAAKADENWDKVLRLTADFENTKKRLAKRRDEAVQFANENIIAEILPLVDDLDRALESFDKNHEAPGIREGLNLIQEKFHRVLNLHGVEAVKSVGEVFDPHLHEALGEVATDEWEEGTVAEELQKGYRLNGRLVRPSKVRIAKRRENEEKARKGEDNGNA